MKKACVDYIYISHAFFPILIYKQNSISFYVQ